MVSSTPLLSCFFVILLNTNSRTCAKLDDGTSPGTSTAEILVNFMADYAEKKLSKFVSPTSNGTAYGGHYYWLGDRYYKQNKDMIRCSFQVPQRFPFVYKGNRSKVTEIIFQCNQNQSCCDGGCCSSKVITPSKIVSAADSGTNDDPKAKADPQTDPVNPKTNVSRANAADSSSTKPVACPEPSSKAGTPVSKSADPPAKSAVTQDGPAKDKGSKSDDGGGGSGGYSMASMIGIAIGVLLLIAMIISCSCCYICRRRRAQKTAGRRGPPPRRGPRVKPGYGTMAKLAIKSRIG